jgi:Ca2+-transporting ATPase
MDISNVIADPSAGVEGMTMAFLTLSMVEMFHSFNMRSRRQSIFTMSRQNWWLWGSFALSLLLTYLVIEVDPIARVFRFATLDPRAYGIALGLAFLVIPINELYKAIMRRVEGSRA